MAKTKAPPAPQQCHWWDGDFDRCASLETTLYDARGLMLCLVHTLDQALLDTDPEAFVVWQRTRDGEEG